MHDDLQALLRDLTGGVLGDLGGAAPAAEARMMALAEVAAVQMRWLWPRRIACRKVTVLVGEPGLGASAVALDIAARASSGAGWPRCARKERGREERGARGGGLAEPRPAHGSDAGSDTGTGQGGPHPVLSPEEREKSGPHPDVSHGESGKSGAAPAGVGVVLVGAGDDLADTIRPRLDAAGADISRFQVLKTISRTDCLSDRQRELAFSLERDVPALDDAIKKTPGCGLVVIDPVVTPWRYGPGREWAAVKKLLDGLTKLAERTGVAVLAVADLERLVIGPGACRVARGLTLAAAARAGWAVVRARSDPTGVRRALVPIKNNLADGQTGLEFHLEGDAATGAVRVVWENRELRLNGADVLAGRMGPAARVEAADWLAGVLARGPRRARVIKRQAERDGIAPRTLYRAKLMLDVRSRREGFARHGFWAWHLPEHDALPVAPWAGEGFGLDAADAELASNGAAGALWNRSAENVKKVPPETP